MLPPDNFQEDPASVVAHRTSPTNIGLVSAFCRLRPRFRLDWRGPNDRTAGGDACDNGSHAALSRPLLQLVRHPRSQRARAQICVLRRQRQSGRPSHRDRQRLQGVEAIADGRRVASGGNRRHARADRRAGRSPASRSPNPDGDAAAARGVACGDDQDARQAPPRRRKRSRRNCRNSPREAAIMVDIAKAIALERSEEADRICLYWSRASLTAIAAHRADLRVCRPRRPLLVKRGCSSLENAFRAMAMAMEFGFLFDRDAPIALDRISRFPNPRWIPIAMTFWRRKRGLPASLRSPRATFRPVTGSGSAAPRRRSPTARR